MAPKYNKIRDDLGKGRQMVRTAAQSFAFVNGTTIAVIAQPPMPFKVKRVAAGSAIATSITTLDVLVLPPGTALDTAPAVGNRLVTPFDTAFNADKKMHDMTLIGGATGVSDRVQVAGSTIVVVLVAGGILGTALASVLVEYDADGQTYGAYDGDSDTQGAYE